MTNEDKKAREIYNTFYQLVADSSHPENKAKQCALICVEEQIKENQSIYSMLLIHGNERSRLAVSMRISELEIIKQIIEQL